MSSNGAMIERDGLSRLFESVALARETAAEAAADVRYKMAAECIRKIAATMDAVSPETLTRLAILNTESAGSVARIISARLCAIAFDLPPGDDAASFFAAVTQEAERTLHTARLH